MNVSVKCVLQARDISREFPGVRALDKVQLTLRAGEVHALMGQNGAGKSTLIKVLTGAYPPSSGTIELDGKTIHPQSPIDAQQLGISTVYQEVNLCPNLSVAENIFAGRYPRKSIVKGGGIDWSAVNQQAATVLQKLQLDIDVTRQLSSYPVAIQQMIAIARATNIDARVLILDEPTSSLDDHEVKQLFAVIRRLRDQGMAILFVTHFLDQVYEVSDRITVLRNGAFVGEYLTSELDRSGLIAAMVGREFAMNKDSLSESTSSTQACVLEVKELSRKGQLHPVDLNIKQGEIVGVAGLLGSGRTELARLLFGLDRADNGSMHVDGKATSFDSPSDAVAHGLALCPEERKTEGIVAELSVRENIVLALQARNGLLPTIPLKEQEDIAKQFVSLLGIKTASIETPIGQLSGGNQQKALLARWLATKPRLLILDEPTRGIDIAAKHELTTAIVDLARKGMAVLFISAEIDEVLRESDRIIVMRDRRKAGELPGGCDEHAVYSLIAEHAS
ncbi:MAG TPA: sugar ABC transporter ATP-binding protein [Steroidobacteraceae bacterium]|nr:sugar ABC transporter ATP-binding protein [Steroidobacteraceae bacterium]